MPFTNHVIFSSREFRPSEKLEMANLLSDESTTNSIMLKAIIHVLNVQESLGLDGFQKDSKIDLFGPNREIDKNGEGKEKDFDQALERHVLAHSGVYSSLNQVKVVAISRDSPKHFLFLLEFPPSKHSLFRWTCASYQSTFRNPSFVGLVRHIKQQLKSDSIKRLFAPLVSPLNPPVLLFGEFIFS
ncbi:hypothetical protein IGI04_011768 [Brassica rapa subsp. trilocularis]|uniref:Uncharacterized protein n=1 Tax=Brassica rapa subsp. trilocularis TaxID=1813537 RepID=A0ABQ7N411_BRACM|nr:hypothetical protein IGI04_011768 [Brassica rapa subsp. trilocularis]